MAATDETQKTFTSEAEESIFRCFSYNIIGMFCEYLNDIKQHSYDKLTYDWWLALLRKLDITNKFEDDSGEIQKKILHSVLAEFSKDFFTQKHTDYLKKNLESAYKSFITGVTTLPYILVN